MNKSNTPMPNRERFLAICHGERTGDVSIIDWFNRYWTDTPKEWVKQGAPKEILKPEGFNQYFQLEHLHNLQEIVSEHNRADLPEVEAGEGFYVTPPIMPVFEKKILREDKRHRIETTYGGATVEISKENPFGMPKYLEYPVKDRATWNEYKKRLNPDTPERWPHPWADFMQKTNSEDVPTLLMIEGFFGILREWTGLEELLYMFYDNPRLVEDMMDHMLYMTMGIVRRTLKDVRVDCIRFWEDMAYKTGPLISPDMFRKYMVPRYKQITEFLHGNGIDVLHVDCDGNIYELIPLWLECGINFHWPLEVAAGMDAVALRKQYGKDLILSGNIDKRALLKGRDAIREEVMSKVPFLLERGGYFPSLDHGIPPDVPLENFRYYINLLREIGGQTKLPE
ncbi:MAG: uroporphyrinogen decarboxylase family protein [Dehalococcoidales bacterium]|nr:uroporphyrinogen decarboxylase family protein [Dehalococcoidales bacterium]